MCLISLVCGLEISEPHAAGKPAWELVSWSCFSVASGDRSSRISQSRSLLIQLGALFPKIFRALAAKQNQVCSQRDLMRVLKCSIRKLRLVITWFTGLLLCSPSRLKVSLDRSQSVGRRPWSSWSTYYSSATIILSKIQRNSIIMSHFLLRQVCSYGQEI